MKFPRNPDRPLLPDRYAKFTMLKTSIHDLETAYKETSNKYVLKALQNLEKLLVIFETEEAVYRKEELEEAYKYIHLLPSAVRVWLLEYREKEMEL